MFLFLVVLTISSTLGLETWLNLFNNFGVEKAGLQGKHIGIIQSIREIPGFLTFLVVFILLFFKEHRLSALSIIILGLGMAVTGLFPSYSGLICTTLVMSLGFHYFVTTCDSLVLQHYDKMESPRILGRLSSLAAATNVVAGVLIFFSISLFTYAQIYLGVGCCIIAAGLWGYFQYPTNPDVLPQEKKLIFRKRYLLYYFLTFMAGARRQIFMAFAVFLMVKRSSYRSSG